MATPPQNVAGNDAPATESARREASARVRMVTSSGRLRSERRRPSSIMTGWNAAGETDGVGSEFVFDLLRRLLRRRRLGRRGRGRRGRLGGRGRGHLRRRRGGRRGRRLGGGGGRGD